MPDPSPTPLPVAEPGYATTEFWGKVIVQVIGLLLTLGVLKPANATPLQDPMVVNMVAGVLAIVVPEIVYAVSRAIRKSGTQG